MTHTLFAGPPPYQPVDQLQTTLGVSGRLPASGCVRWTSPGTGLLRAGLRPCRGGVRSSLGLTSRTVDEGGCQSQIADDGGVPNGPSSGESGAPAAPVLVTVPGTPGRPAWACFGSPRLLMSSPARPALGHPSARSIGAPPGRTESGNVSEPTEPRRGTCGRGGGGPPGHAGSPGPGESAPGR